MDVLPKAIYLASSKDEALDIAIKSAEAAMKGLKLAKDANEKARQSTRVQQLLAEAERIKHSPDWRRTIAALSRSHPSPSQRISAAPRKVSVGFREPQHLRQPPRSEEILLLKAGYLNGFKFPPWSAPPTSDEFTLKEGEGPFE